MPRVARPPLELVPSSSEPRSGSEPPSGILDDGPGPASPGRIAFDDLYTQHARYIAHLVGKVLGRDDEVVDVVQDVFLIAHRRLGTLRDPALARWWLGRIAVREASRKLRWRRLRLFLSPAGALEEDSIVDPTVEPELRPLAALLFATLDRIPAKERVAWTLRHLSDEPLDNVAELCGCSLATAKRRIAAAEQILRPILTDDDGEGRTP